MTHATKALFFNLCFHVMLPVAHAQQDDLQSCVRSRRLTGVCVEGVNHKLRPVKNGKTGLIGRRLALFVNGKRAFPIDRRFTTRCSTDTISGTGAVSHHGLLDGTFEKLGVMDKTNGLIETLGPSGQNEWSVFQQVNHGGMHCPISHVGSNGSRLCWRAPCQG